MSLPDMAEYDPWTAPLDDLAKAARAIESYADPTARDISTIDAQRQFAAHILNVLQARSALEAARVQKEAIEAQTETTQSLVRGTWWLVGATIVLALAAIFVA